ncbi:hypothetical protein G7Y89_g13755 [Cudoniella acicularis]|uniref:Reactive oxygen species modulator 1 n=1 Tax=Cudoniella acicularis TaxID=354080 RepID=A0A8H4VVQ6_9HELO|nr:hypothetical protein G7Y89_g13755 [Cudoniella acicularis]
MPVPVGANMGGPSTFDKLKMGAMMGGTVGVIIGFIFGSVNIMRYGAGPNGVMRSLGQYMLGSGATFGTIRTETTTQQAMEAFARAQRYPLVMPRAQYRPSRHE